MELSSTPTASARPGGPDVFLFGVSKAASTWIHRCLLEHPEVFVPQSDSLRFFDLRYHEGIESYEAHFAAAMPGQVKVDASPTYLRSPVAARRVAHHYPQARFVISLRNPVERAFSQFWHEKKFGRIDYSFEEAIEHLMFFPWFVEHGFYARHLERLFAFFPRDRVAVVLYEDLVADPRHFLDAVLRSMGLQAGFSPSTLGRRVNEAAPRMTGSMKVARGLRGVEWLRPLRRAVKRISGRQNLLRDLGNAVSDRNEYERGMSEPARQLLRSIYQQEILDLEALIGLDLSRWREQ
ncbi:MAG: sulfotransferase [Burkholderiales bacterium]|nr:sulfotransferase [Burkholderiales bacterium]